MLKYKENQHVASALKSAKSLHTSDLPMAEERALFTLLRACGARLRSARYMIIKGLP